MCVCIYFFLKEYCEIFNLHHILKSYKNVKAIKPIIQARRQSRINFNNFASSREVVCTETEYEKWVKEFRRYRVASFTRMACSTREVGWSRKLLAATWDWVKIRRGLFVGLFEEWKEEEFGIFCNMQIFVSIQH